MTTASTSGSYILFTVAGTTYALPSEDVRHMEMIEQITPVPNAAPSVEGVVFSRGQIVAVLNLRVRFGFERVPHDARTRLLVVQSQDRWVGLVVDSAREFVSIPPTAIQPPSHGIAGLSGRYLEGIATLGDRVVLILNVAEILNTTAVSADLTAAPGAPVAAGQQGVHTGEM